MQLHQLPFAAPDWNPADPLASFKRFALFIHDKAKETLLRDKTHAEMFFCLDLKGQGHIVLWQEKDRNLQANWIRQHINDHYLYGIVHVCEAWAHFAKQPNEHTQKQLEAGEMRVSQLRPEHRSDVLTVLAQSRDGYSHSWVDEVLKNKADGSLWLGEYKECDDLEGRFGKLFG